MGKLELIDIPIIGVYLILSAVAQTEYLRILKRVNENCTEAKTKVLSINQVQVNLLTRLFNKNN
tara:strand:- start:74 stop:265 length:192 start_codon:yes stop_codon:yes gene_type:complete